MVAAGVLVLPSACGGDGATSAHRSTQVVVTTSILGDVVQNLVGDAATVEVIMPPGTNPHGFAPSAQQALAMRQADVLVVNGLGFEAGLVDTIDAAERDGTAVVRATDGVDTLGKDPHFFTDPVRMRAATRYVADALAREVTGLDSSAYQRRVGSYLAGLAALDQDIRSLLTEVPPGRRKLVTNHEVFAYFADRYGFEVLGSVIPRGTTLAEPSASRLQELADKITEARVAAIFADTSSPKRLANALAGEGLHVAVVDLYSESLGASDSDGATYLDMMRTDAERIAAALG